MSQELNTQPDYFTARMLALGATDENNSIKIWKTDVKDSSKTILVPEAIFKRHEKGIEITPYTLDRHHINFTPENGRWRKKWSLIRLEHPITKEDGQQMKYQLPKGAGSFPFFPPVLLDKYEQKTPITTLFLTEGYFKAFKGSLHGLDIIGLTSITHLVDKNTGTLHPEILKLILVCSVQRVVWLTDGDCLNISTSLKDEVGKPKDLSIRPKNFYNSILKFKQLLDDYDVEKYFMHIDSDNIPGKPKGLDDLLIELPDLINSIVVDMCSVSKPGQWVQKFNITGGGLTKVRNYFHLTDVTDFYLFHSDRRKDLKDQEFIFNGTQYRWDEKENRCVIVVPGESKNYFRVGDYYYEFVQIPNQHKQLEKVFQERKKSTITDDHGKDFLRHVAKYKAFCNVPDHQNYQQTLHNCFNVYSPLDFKPDEEESTPEDCPIIINFLRHLFGENKIKSVVNGVSFETTTYEMGLDYIQLLYQRPDEKLPILCLVSKENNTGKSTLGNFLRLMLGANVAIVGNQDLAGDFNAHWATKCVCVLDEAKIDKQHVVEKVKMLSTAKKIMMNAKGKSHNEIDCFLKFIFITNNEESFISASEEDIRFWVIKIPKLEKELPNILENFVDELPAFLSYLSRRKMATSKQGRMWFHPQLLRTDALKKVIAFSEPVIAKEIRQQIREMFFDFGTEQILMSRKAVHKEFFNNRYEASYLDRVLKEILKLDQYFEWDKSTLDENGQAKKVYKVIRFSYPKWDVKYKDGNQETVRVEITETGRPYVFKRSQFLSAEEINSLFFSEQTMYENKLISGEPGLIIGIKPDHLPF